MNKSSRCGSGGYLKPHSLQCVSSSIPSGGLPLCESVSTCVVGPSAIAVTVVIVEGLVVGVVDDDSGCGDDDDDDVVVVRVDRHFDVYWHSS